MDEEEYWRLLTTTILAAHDPEDVALAELDPLHQKIRSGQEPHWHAFPLFGREIRHVKRHSYPKCQHLFRES